MEGFCIIIRIYNRQKDLSIAKASARALVRSALDHLGVFCDDVSVLFVAKRPMAQLHGQFFQDPTPTDCISFPSNGEELGEIFVCPAIAIQYARKRNLDPYAEASLYVVHGLLHLLGYGDLEEKERRIMRKKEKSCMRHLYKLKNLLSRK